MTNKSMTHLHLNQSQHLILVEGEVLSSLAIKGYQRIPEASRPELQHGHHFTRHFSLSRPLVILHKAGVKSKHYIRLFLRVTYCMRDKRRVGSKVGIIMMVLCSRDIRDLYNMVVLMEKITNRMGLYI